MNFPYETEKSYLYGGNCLIMEVNPSVPDKPISKKSRIFASDYQSLKKDSNRLFYIQHDKFRPVNKILKAYDFVKNRDPLPAQQDEGTPFEFTLQEVIDLLQQMEAKYKTISERETAYSKEHLFLNISPKGKIRRILGETARIIENYRNELRIIAHEQENREY